MSFALDLSKLTQSVIDKNNLLVKQIIFELSTSLVLKSPVGDAKFWKSPAPVGYVGGRFRANWQYGLDAPNPATTEDIDPSGAATIAAIVGKVGDEPAGHIHYLTNSLPYALRIEDGWSYRQAPQGVVGITILEFEPMVEAVARELNK